MKKEKSENLILGENYTNNNKTFPLVSTQYNSHYESKPFILNIPRYNPETLISPDEIFVVIDDRVVNNIMTDRYLVSNYGRVFDRAEGKYLKYLNNQDRLSNGINMHYDRVSLAYYYSWENISYARVLVHRIVMLMFGYIKYAEDKDNSKLEVNHINSIRFDNRLSNLEFCTSKENSEHAKDNNVTNQINYLMDSTNYVYDKTKRIDKVCMLLEKGYTDSEIETFTCVNKELVWAIRNSDIFSKYTKSYNIPKDDNSINVVIRDKVIEVCEMLQSGKSYLEIVEYVKVSSDFINKIKNRELYTEISKYYSW